MNNRKGDWIQTYTGIQFFPMDPRPEDINKIDVAHALSMKCRFNGHCTRFYSVAQHSVLVSKECLKRWPGELELALWGLLHDAAEAYLPDVPRPVKMNGTGVLPLCEEKIMEIVVTKFRLFPKYEPPGVKEVDSALLATEQQQLMSVPPAEWHLPEPPLSLKIFPANPSVAKGLFLSTWELLERKIRGSQ